MGIQGLMKVIADNAPGAIKENVIKNFFGRKIAIDASMSLYQFLIAVRPDDTNTFTLTNDVGETTSHLIGFFYRTIRLVESGIKPVYVFDGKPPTLKSGELAKRTKKRKEAEEAVTEAKEEGDQEALAKLNKRTLRVLPQHSEEAKKLLSLMGIPYVNAPCEAEAQCAAMVKDGMCYGAGSEDMDSLTLGVPLLLRHLNYSESRGLPILEIRLEKVLEGLGMDMDQFIDLCILLGCDYCDSIRGIGPVRAMQLIHKYKNIEGVLESLDHEKYKVPENFPYKEIRELFKHPEVTDPSTLEVKWTAPDEEGLIEFLVKQKGFSEDRVRRGVEKLNKCRTSAVQNRITSFFSAAPVEKKAKPEPAHAKNAKKAGAKKSSSLASTASSASPSSSAAATTAAILAAKPKPETTTPYFVPVKSEPSEDAPTEPASDAATEKEKSSTSDVKVKAEDPSHSHTGEEKKPQAVHSFFQPRSSKKSAAAAAPKPKEDTKVETTSTSTASEPKKTEAIAVVRKGRIIEDDGDD